VATRSLPPFPQGWFAAGFSDELKPGAVLTRAFLGGEVVLFRTEDGVAAATDPWCPHLGAHLGQGRVVDGGLRCAFHGFRFAPDGSCLGTALGGRPPPRAQLALRRLREVNGILLVWHDPFGADPAWDAPAAPAGDFSPPATAAFRLPAHPQDVMENGVDLAHLATLHGHRSVAAAAPVEFEGPRFRARYALRRDDGLFGRGGRAVRVETVVESWGLGYACIDLAVASHGLHVRHVLLATPVAEGELDLRVGISLRRDVVPRRVDPLLGLLPRAQAERRLLRRARDSFLGELQQDFAVWSRKTHLDRPALAEGDAAVARYRQWARQFYPAFGLPTARRPRIAREKKA
jgi:nitrite reductase/ring-hydroxylating ferredoxin subunit